MRRRVLAMIALTIFPALTWSAEALSPRHIAAKFFETFLNGGSVEAVDYFMGLSPLLKANSEQILQMKALLTSALRLYGEPIGVEEVSVEEITVSLQRHVYLTKHASHPLIWEMYFYKPKDQWIPDQLLFVDQYQILGKKK